MVTFLPGRPNVSFIVLLIVLEIPVMYYLIRKTSRPQEQILLRFANVVSRRRTRASTTPPKTEVLLEKRRPLGAATSYAANVELLVEATTKRAANDDSPMEDVHVKRGPEWGAANMDAANVGAPLKAVAMNTANNKPAWIAAYMDTTKDGMLIEAVTESVASDYSSMDAAHMNTANEEPVEDAAIVSSANGETLVEAAIINAGNVETPVKAIAMNIANDKPASNAANMDTTNFELLIDATAGSVANDESPTDAAHVHTATDASVDDAANGKTPVEAAIVEAANPEAARDAANIDTANVDTPMKAAAMNSSNNKPAWTAAYMDTATVETPVKAAAMTSASRELPQEAATVEEYQMKTKTARKRAKPADYSYFSNLNIPDLNVLANNKHSKIKECTLFPWETNSRFNIKGDTNKYFRSYGAVECFSEGVDKSKVSSKSTSCPCGPGWHGDACSIPDVVKYSNLRMQERIQPRLHDPPRKIINAFPFNIEFESLEVRFAELYDIVDVFLILESNTTSYGDPKPLLLLDRLKAGYLNKYACKVIHVFLDYFPKENYEDGWEAVYLQSNYLSSKGLHRLANLNDNDIFLLNDADELPTRESVLFLKLHVGYPYPINWLYRPHVYGYFWRKSHEPQQIGGAASIAFVVNALHEKSCNLRSFDRNLLLTFDKSMIEQWAFGNTTHPAGWHCSWCGSPEQIRIKLMSAPNCDFPRWGDYADKCQLPYIESLIGRGVWFDEQTNMLPSNTFDQHFAPVHILKHRLKYKDFLINKYAVDDHK